jgi:hypothetical protein
MKYFCKRRSAGQTKPYGEQAFSDEDPMNGVANLFDVGLVFIVGLILTLFAAYRLDDLFSEKSSFTMMKQSADGQLEIITKEGKKINAVKVTKESAKGKGTRLGTAYRLEDGSMVYVPDQGGAK